MQKYVIVNIAWFDICLGCKNDAKIERLGIYKEYWVLQEVVSAKAIRIQWAINREEL